MSYLTWKERLRIPTYDNPSYANTGQVTIDEEKCNGCGDCVMICPGSALYLAGVAKHKKAHLMEVQFPECIACNDCAAMCRQGAITASVTYDFGLFYKVLHRGDLCAPRRF